MKPDSKIPKYRYDSSVLSEQMESPHGKTISQDSMRHPRCKEATQHLSTPNDIQMSPLKVETVEIIITIHTAQ